MPDSQSNVEINLRINATNREAVNQLQNDLNRLKGTVTESTGQYTGFTGAVTGAERATNIFGGQARTASATTTGLGTAASAAKTEVAGLSVALSAVTLGQLAAGAAFAAMGVGLAAAISKGIELQQGLQNLREGVAGVLTTDSANFGGGQAGRAATAAIDQIVISAKAAQIPISDLTKSFDAIFPSAARANTSIAGLSNLLAQLTAQQGALHISQTKMVSDLEAIFNGTVSNSNVLAQNLGITKEQAAAWRENGTITDELAQKVQSFGAAHTETSDTIDRAQQKINAAFEQFAVAVAKPLVEPLTNALNAMSAAMNSVDATNVVTQLERIIAVAGSVISAMQNVGKAIANALQSAISFAGSIPLGEGEGSQGGRPVGAGPGFPTGLQAGGSSINEVLQKQLDFEREVGDLTTRGTGTSPLVGGTKGGGGGGGAAGPSQDVLNQQEISKIQSEINEKESAYHTLIEENTVAHKLGQASLGQMQSADAKASQVFIGAIDQSREKLVAMKAAVDATGQAQGGLNDKEQTQINRLQTAIDKLDLLKARTQLFAAGQNFFGGFTQGLQKFSDDPGFNRRKSQPSFWPDC